MKAVKNGIWFSGVASFIFGLSDRTFASLSDGLINAIDLVQLFTASLIFVAWLFLKPESTC